MTNPFARLLALVLLLLVAAAAAPPRPPAAPHRPNLPKKRVLCLNSYQRGLTWTDDMVAGAEDAFRQSDRFDIEFVVAYMDAKHNSGPAYIEALRSFYAAKYVTRPMDVVMTTDDFAFDFMLAHGEGLFPGVPHVFCGVNYFDPRRLADHPRVTGVVESFDVLRTVHAALGLQPKLGQFVVITDQTDTGIANKRILLEKIMPVLRPGHDLEFTFIEDVTLSELQARLARLGPTSAVLILNFNRDKAGAVFSHEESAERLAEVCPVPIYGMWDFYLGHGVVGGMLTSGRNQGRDAARLALQILAGTRPETLPVITQSPNQFMFDLVQLQRFGLDRSRLPPGSIIINEPPTWVAVNRRQIWVAAGVTGGVLAGLAALALHIQLRRRAEAGRYALEEKLREHQKLESMGIMAGGIAHDFNNLLMNVLGNASLARTDVPPDSTAARCLQDIEKVGRQAATLTQQLLAYSGHGKLATEPLDLSKLIATMAPLMERAISKKARLHLALSPGLPRIDGDAAQLRQVVMNLVANASEAVEGGGRPSGEIRLGTGVTMLEPGSVTVPKLDNLPAAQTCVYIEVVDDGVGIPAKDLPRIFDPFFTSKRTGRGLGLAAVLGIVRGHGGVLQVHSREGHGARFRVLLPPAAASETEPTAADEGSPDPARDRRGSGTVVVIDDEESVRNVCTAILHRAGFSVLTARSGPDGIELLRRSPPGVRAVLLNLTMPEMSVAAALAEIARIAPGVPVVLSSGFGRVDTTTGLSPDRYAGFIQKPYTPDGLIRELHRVLDAAFG